MKEVVAELRTKHNIFTVPYGNEHTHTHTHTHTHARARTIYTVPYGYESEKR